jgi:hypothetical protein
MEVSSQFHVPSTLPLGKNPGAQWLGDWLGTIDGLRVFWEKETPLSLPGIKPRIYYPDGSNHYFSLSETSSFDPGLRQLAIQLVPGIKRPECKDHDSPPSSVEIKNEWSYSSTPRVYLHGVFRDNCAFSFA